MILSSVLLLGSWAAAQSDPFQRQAPEQTLPTIRAASTMQAPPASGTPARQSMAGSLQVPVQMGFGNPRSSNDGGTTRVVFDLASHVNYTLTPTFSGLRLDIQGARVIPSVTGRMGSSVTEYRAGNGQITLVTPFPLSLTDGWRAYEATIVGGTKVLILEFGATLTGGAGSSVRGAVLTSAPISTPAVKATLNTPLQADSGVAPGDTVTPGPLLPSTPALPGSTPDRPSALMGRVPGSAIPGATLTVPRIGKNPGLTRTVLDLPPGVSYRIVPGNSGLRVELTGVSVNALTQPSGTNISAELQSWHYEPTSNGVNIIFQTGWGTSIRSGWRAQLLPPSNGERSRLAIDLSPALADTTPLGPREKMLAGVPPISTNRGTALLSLAANYARPRVVIDPGHGGVDPGAVGIVVEKEVNLAVGLRVRDLLQAAGVDVVMTRSTDTQLSTDKNTDLNARAALGAGAQMYVSIHVNAMTASKALRGYGIETWWNPNHPLSQNLASVLQRDMLMTTGAADQGLHNTRSLAVLRNSRIPAALVEIGFTSHPVDGLNLKDSNYLDRVALGIATGIREALVTGVTANGKVTRGSVGGSDR